MELDVGAVALALGGAIVGAALVTVVLRIRRRARRKPRIVEAPNSHYRAPGVADLMDRERWESIRLERLHELNREEVRALLGRLKADGIRALSRSDRDFLDRMARVAGTHRPGRSGSASANPSAAPG